MGTGGQDVRTSQCLSIAVRPPIRDLSGGKASADSFTRSATTLAEAYIVDPKLDSDLFLLVVVLRLRIRSQGFGRLLFLVTDWAGSEPTLSACAEGRLAGSLGIRLFAYCWMPGSVTSKEQWLAKLRIRCRDLGLIPTDVVLPDSFRLSLGRRQHHSWLRFVPADPFVVERGIRRAACRGQIGVDGGVIADSDSWQTSANPGHFSWATFGGSSRTPTGHRLSIRLLRVEQVQTRVPGGRLSSVNSTPGGQRTLDRGPLPRGVEEFPLRQFTNTQRGVRTSGKTRG